MRCPEPGSLSRKEGAHSGLTDCVHLSRIDRLHYLAGCLVANATLATLYQLLEALASNRPVIEAGLAVRVIIITMVTAWLTVRRLRDMGWSQWLALLMALPYLNVALFLLAVVYPGQRAANRYGQPPLSTRKAPLLLLLLSVAAYGMLFTWFHIQDSAATY